MEVAVAIILTHIHCDHEVAQLEQVVVQGLPIGTGRLL